MNAVTAAARVQVGAGLWGVTKVIWRDWPRRNAASWSWAVGFLVGGAAAVLTVGRPGSPPTTAWVAAGVLMAVVVVRLLLEARTPEDAGPPVWDRQLVDPWWTTIHAGTGVVLGLWGVPWWLALALVIGWELVEIVVPGFGDEEINGNRVADIGVALLGWSVVSLLG